MQLAKENRKFMYSALRHGARAAEYERAILWLADAGLTYKVRKVKKMQKPLSHYEDDGAFKLYALDLGLMGAMAGTKAADVLSGNSVFMEFKGAFTEQYVLQQFISSTGKIPHYYTNDHSTLEIDFVAEGETVYPIEVKAKENLKSKSLKTVLEKEASLEGWRFSMAGYREQERMTNIPLYLAQEWFRTYCNEGS